MRISRLVLLLSVAVSLAHAGTLPPLSVKDISLMLRTGYSAAAVEQETAARRFMGTLDSASEKVLTDAGASPAFVAALKSGAYAVPAGEIAAVREQVTAEARRRALQAEEARRSSTPLQPPQVQAPTIPQTPLTAPMQHVLASFLKGDLVTSKNGVLSTFNDQVMENKKLIALYFSARWCGPCRKFTPQLVEFYNRVAPAHPEFELVFVSGDRSAPAMEAYMRDMQMPWPAINYPKIEEKIAVRKYAGSGIPCLVVVDAAGKVVADSYHGTTYLGPGKVLTYLEQAFAVQTAAR